jgi:tRNA-splicing ligase RtcB
MKIIEGIPIWGTPDEGAVSQIKTCAKTADRVALMAVAGKRQTRTENDRYI